MLRGAKGRPVQNAQRVGAELDAPIFEIKLFSQKMVLVRSAAIAAELCDENRFEKKLPPGVAALRSFAGDGLFTAYSDEPNWQLAHDLLRPAFTRAAMQTYHPTMVTVARELIDKWDRTPLVDVSPDLTRLTLETIGRTSFSTSFDSFTNDETDPFVTAMVSSLRRGQRRGAFAGMPFARQLAARRQRGELPADQAYMEQVIDKIIARRIESADRGTGDLLGLMLNSADESGAKLDLVNVRRQILTFLVAGHETTSGALSFALYYLASNPQVRALAQQEADQILGQEDYPSFDQVAKFRYIRRVLDEALRLWPTAPGFARGPRERTTLAQTYDMGPDDYCIVSAMAVHRDPSVWGSQPETFDPDNFLPERIRARPAHTYFPFGTGERACIGRQFALHEAVLLLAAILHRYDFAAEADYELTVNERLTLMPTGLNLRFWRRDGDTGTDAQAIDRNRIVSGS
ncbi:cytochrome P450 [Calidifontibacter terrae]